MSVGLKIPSSIFSIEGIRLSAISAGLYNKKRLDLVLFELDKDSVVSAVFTKNKFCAAPVKIAKQHLGASRPYYCLVNAGNANAGTGQEGLDSALKNCQKLASLTQCDFNQVLPFSTGVIGEEFPENKINTVLPELVKKLSSEAWLDAAKGIMTTDTMPKVVSKQLRLGDSVINITGIAKGSGMIKPNMATMLSFIATDARLDKQALNKLLEVAVNKSFNRISVDGDTSTNDACVLIATGKADAATIEVNSGEAFTVLENALVNVFTELAQAIVRDGEGATKYIEIEVDEGETNEDCLAVAYQIANSPLVKTAFTASDPNWGRILAAIGNAEINNVEISDVSIYLDELCIVRNGACCEEYTEEAGKEIMMQEEIKISVKLAVGSAKETIWTTDLSHEYITINAEYRT